MTKATIDKAGRVPTQVKSETGSEFGAGGMELAVDLIEWARGCLVVHRGADRLAADRPFKAHFPHQ